MHNDPSIISTTELTEREKEILRLVATGTSNKEIARQLFISSNTVKVHVRNIFAKIGASTRTEAAMYAVRIGLVQSPGIEADGITQAKPSSEDLHRSPDSPSREMGDSVREDGILTASQESPGPSTLFALQEWPW